MEKHEFQPDLDIYPDVDSLVQAAAERITSVLREKLDQEEIVTLVLTGGRTPKPVYQLLAAAPYCRRISWNRILVFWGDERCVAPEHPDSNFGMAWQALLSKVDIPPENLHRIRGELQDPEEAAALYEDEIRELFPESAIPAFDLVLLGMGEDGHTASLFPGTKWNGDKLVVATRIPSTGDPRISMTPRLLNEAGTIIFLVAGAGKASALAEVLNRSNSNLPASRIRPVRGRLIRMVDSAAASLATDFTDYTN